MIKITRMSDAVRRTRACLMEKASNVGDEEVWLIVGIAEILIAYRWRWIDGFSHAWPDNDPDRLSEGPDHVAQTRARAPAARPRLGPAAAGGGREDRPGPRCGDAGLALYRRGNRAPGRGGSRQPA